MGIMCGVEVIDVGLGDGTIGVEAILTTLTSILTRILTNILTILMKICGLTKLSLLLKALKGRIMSRESIRSWIQPEWIIVIVGRALGFLDRVNWVRHGEKLARKLIFGRIFHTIVINIRNVHTWIAMDRGIHHTDVGIGLGG